MNISHGRSAPSGPQPTWQADAGGGDWTDIDPRPCLELDRDGRLVRTNAAGERLIAARVVTLDAGRRIRLSDAGSDRRFDEAVRNAADRPRQTLVVAAQDGRARSALLLAPPVASTLLLVFGEAELRPEGFAAIAEAFELTRGETRVLQSLCEGASAREIAQTMHISEHTVRSHLRAIYGKLGVRRLSNLIRLAVQLAT